MVSSLMNEPNIIQEIMVDFQAINNELNVELQSPPFTEAEFGNVYVVESDNRVLYATTETWNSMPSLVSKKGFIYIYSDWKKDDLGNNIASVKFGDGNAYLIDIPFKDDMWWAHINDAVIHVTPEEREFWNNKITCYSINNGENTTLVLTKQ